MEVAAAAAVRCFFVSLLEVGTDALKGVFLEFFEEKGGEILKEGAGTPEEEEGSVKLTSSSRHVLMC
jgi:hypothetical protein